jgi:Putative peptidoglycan binding domain
MTLQVGGYQPAKTCTGSPQPGTQALMAWYLGAYGAQGAANLGIYVCKSIAGSATTSLHGEGRAADCGSKPYRRLGFMADLADAFVAHSKELGIQCVIHNRRIWSASYPHAGWRTYRGEDHVGHLHVELLWWAARDLTVAKINSVLHGSVVVRPDPPKPTTPAKPDDWTRRMIMALPELKHGTGLKGKHNEDVQTMQQLLQARGFRAGQGKAGADGRFGDGTRNDLRAFQRSVKIKDDGICGKVTWAHLLRQPGAIK